MGVNIRVYGIFGIKVPNYVSELSNTFQDQDDDGLLPSILSDGAIFDGMNGKYMVFGIPVYNSADFRYTNDTKPVSLSYQDLLNLKNLEETYKSVFRIQFPDFAHFMEPEFKLEIFVHYS